MAIRLATGEEDWLEVGELFNLDVDLTGKFASRFEDDSGKFGLQTLFLITKDQFLQRQKETQGFSSTSARPKDN